MRSWAHAADNPQELEWILWINCLGMFRSIEAKTIHTTRFTCHHHKKDIKIMNMLTTHEVPLFQLNTKDVSLERKSMYSSFVVAPYVS